MIARSNRSLLIGATIGVVVPLVAFAPLWVVDLDSASASTSASAGATVWAATAFLGVLLTALERTRRYGVGVLLGFSALLVVGTGTCTVAVMAFQP